MVRRRRALSIRRSARPSPYVAVPSRYSARTLLAPFPAHTRTRDSCSPAAAKHGAANECDHATRSEDPFNDLHQCETQSVRRRQQLASYLSGHCQVRAGFEPRGSASENARDVWQQRCSATLLLDNCQWKARRQKTTRQSMKEFAVTRMPSRQRDSIVMNARLLEAL